MCEQSLLSYMHGCCIACCQRCANAACCILPLLLAVQDALGVLRTGIALRQVAATQYNAASSRSHCIFTCHVESRLEPQPGLVNVRSSRLHLVDLAGSERLRYGLGGMALGEGGDRQLKETTAINTSLSVLGLVILRLTEQQPHIPYRNSKLTFLLQVSVRGTAACSLPGVGDDEVEVEAAERVCIVNEQHGKANQLLS